MKLHPLVIIALSAALNGCAVPSSTVSTPTGTDLTGNWEFAATSSTRGSAPIGIYLIQSGNTVSGIAGVQMAFAMCIGQDGIPCAFPFGVINPNLGGTVYANGKVTLGSSTGGTLPATLSVTASSTNTSTLSGTYSITMGTASDSGTVTGNLIAPVNGTYTGTVVSTYTGQSMGVTMTVSQLPGIDSYGFLRLTSSASFTGSSCFSALTSGGPPATYSGLLGNSLYIEFVGASNPNISVAAFGAVSPDAKTIQFHYGVIGGGCADDIGNGTLTRQ